MTDKDAEQKEKEDFHVEEQDDGEKGQISSQLERHWQECCRRVMAKFKEKWRAAKETGMRGRVKQ